MTLPELLGTLLALVVGGGTAAGTYYMGYGTLIIVVATLVGLTIGAVVGGTVLANAVNRSIAPPNEE